MEQVTPRHVASSPWSSSTQSATRASDKPCSSCAGFDAGHGPRCGCVARPQGLSEAELDAVRIDRWLWAARFFRDTAGAATDAVLGGRIHLNGARVKPAKDVQAGDTVQVTLGDTRREVVILTLDKRGSAAVAQSLYEETPDSITRRQQRSVERRSARPLGADLGARPTKQDRRRLDALRRAERRHRRGTA